MRGAPISNFSTTTSRRQTTLLDGAALMTSPFFCLIVKADVADWIRTVVPPVTIVEPPSQTISMSVASVLVTVNQ